MSLQCQPTSAPSGPKTRFVLKSSPALRRRRSLTPITTHAPASCAARPSASVAGPGTSTASRTSSTK